MLDSLFVALGYGLCHQLPERSFIAGGHQLPVCARDTGIYIGFAIALLVLWVLSRGRRPVELPRWPVLVLLGLFVSSMAFDGLTSYAGLRPTTNELRLATGLATGWALATITLPMLNAQLWTRYGNGRVLETVTDTTVWLAALPVAYAVSWWVLPATGVLYPLLLSAAIIGVFITVNLVLVTLLPPFERKADRLRDAWLPIVIAGALAAAEIGGAALLRNFAERML